MSPTPSNEPGRDGVRPASARVGPRSGAVTVALLVALVTAACSSPATAPSTTTTKPAPTTTSVPAGQLVFGGRHPVTPGPGLDTVSCASPTSCVAIDAGGGIYSFQGAAWAGPVSPAPGPVGGGGISVSCADPSLCAAVPTAGSQVVTGTGQSWSPPQTLPGATDLGAVGCAPTGYCASVDAEGYAFAFDDGRWGATSGDWGSVADIACVSSTFCVSVSGGISQWNGSSWTQPDSYAAVGSFTSVSCPSAVFSAAAVNSGDVMFLQGQTWGPPTRIEPGPPSTTSVGPYPTSVSCPSTTYCAAVDGNGAVLQWSGSAWSYDKVDPGRHLTAVSCPTTTFCAAVDSFGDVIFGRPA